MHEYKPCKLPSILGNMHVRLWTAATWKQRLNHTSTRPMAWQQFWPQSCALQDMESRCIGAWKMTGLVP